MTYDFDTNIILIADDFYEAFQRCSEGRNPRNISGCFVTSAPNVPAIVNGAFAIELYFKSMLPPKTSGHKLNILFDSLTGDIKCEIREATTKQLEKLSWGKSFKEYIEDINNVFVDWRYISEKDYSVGYLGNRINEYLQVFEFLLPIIKDIAHKHNPA